MKIIELTSDLSIALNNEEVSLMEKFGDSAVAKSKLNEREQVIANQLVIKDVLLRTNEEGKIHYSKRV